MPAERICVKHTYSTVQTESGLGVKLTYNNGPDGEEHEGVLLQERLHVLFGDLLHFPLRLHRTYVDPFSEALHPAGGKRNTSMSGNSVCADFTSIFIMDCFSLTVLSKSGPKH